MDFNPDNTAAQFMTKLTEVVELEGNWEVGLMEILLPSRAHNVDETGFHYSLHYEDGSIDRFVMRSGTYATQSRVVRELRNIGKRDNVPMVNWEYSTNRQRITFTFANGSTSSSVINNAAIELTMSEDLGALIGFDPSKTYTAAESTIHAGERPPKLTAGFENVYVYCDVLEHVLVGDTKTPLLRVLHRKGSDYGSEHVVFNPVQYVPLQKKCFDTIGMHLMNDGGRPIPFIGGKSIAVLEFRQTTHPYLSL